jgi:UDP-2,4-diacetamido-2,4,6-trideoxy-beta-L-altropyranose hydrolase
MFAFRVDSSRDVGSGHVMRCLSLAERLMELGKQCVFLCRPAPGDLMNEIERRGHTVLRMPALAERPAMSESEDACAAAELLSGHSVDWLIVDHYGLGLAWEQAAAEFAHKLLVIDDIGREHRCTLLLDQNFPNPMHDRYRRMLADDRLLMGPRFALLRAEFAALRPVALQRRDGSLGRFLVSMGGSDPGNETAKALAGLKAVWRPDWQVDAVIGVGNPHLSEIEAACSHLPAATLHVQTSKMAQLMSAADCAIGAGGSTTWERCCLGLPAVVVILSADQASIATTVGQTGAQSVLGWSEEVTVGDYAREISVLSQARLTSMSAAAAGICDGLGASRVAERLQ